MKNSQSANSEILLKKYVTKIFHSQKYKSSIAKEINKGIYQ